MLGICWKLLEDKDRNLSQEGLEITVSNARDMFHRHRLANKT